MRIWLLLLVCSMLLMQPIYTRPISDKDTKKSRNVLYAPPRFYVAQKDLTFGLKSRASSARFVYQSPLFYSPQTLKANPSSTTLVSQMRNKKTAPIESTSLTFTQATQEGFKTPRISKEYGQMLDSKPTYYKPDSPSTYLNTTIGLLGGGIIVSIIGLYIMPESVTNWDRSHFGFKAWLQDVQIGPVIDADNFWLNGVMHPYFGAVYYMQPRVAGYSWAESALFSFIASSFLWEYGIEAFVEIPSWQDLIYTPAMGSIFGEIFYQSTKYIQSNDNHLFGSKILGLIVLGLMDPIGVVMRDFGLAKSMGVRDMRQITSYATPMRVGFAMRF